MIEQIELGTTRDGFQIVGFAARAAAPHPAWVILVHQRGTDHAEFAALTKKLTAAGLSTLAVDLRGHGHSVVRSRHKPQVVDHPALTPGDWRRTYCDVALAVKFVRAERAPFARRVPFALLGASIGASAVIRAVARDEYLQGRPLVLLSPGLDYRGVEVAAAWPQLHGAPILVVRAAFDGPTIEFHRRVAEQLQDTVTRFLVVKGDAHGSKLLSQGRTTQQVVAFLRGHLAE
jgi:alpha-beta hydrolase superfamily lysophospholipase